MDELNEQINVLSAKFDEAAGSLHLEDLRLKLHNLKEESKNPNLWNNTAEAQTLMKDLASLEAQVNPWNEIEKSLKEHKELIALKDPSLEGEIKDQLKKVEQKIDELTHKQRFSGPHDESDVILSIYAGAGGTDAQDWAQMLQRMYTRWAEQNGFKVRLLDVANGEEAGIKNSILEISGPRAYGKLKNENGVHRLVRLSPFNSDQKRHTSFAKVDVLPKINRPQELEIQESDLKIDVYRAGGHGGQSVNTTDSAVRITHLPTNISVAIQNERSQLQNKETAMTILRSRLAKLQEEQHKKNISEIKGPNQSAEWGNQIRSYVLHPYKQVKDLRTGYETSDAGSVLDGNLEELLNA